MSLHNRRICSITERIRSLSYEPDAPDYYCFISADAFVRLCFRAKTRSRVRRPLACEPLEPRTKLEDIESRYESVITKGFTQYATLNVRGVEVRLDAVEIKDTANSARALGFVIALKELGDKPRENRSFIDYKRLIG
ncbi:MAG: hypothetical protein ACR2HX_13675 [Pyrinomonadaceae bacterium]